MELVLASLGSPLLDGISVPAFLRRPDATVVAANGPAGALLAPWARAPFQHPAGELLGCLNARDAGCGRGPRCAQCPVRNAVRQAQPFDPLPAGLAVQSATSPISMR